MKWIGETLMYITRVDANNIELFKNIYKKRTNKKFHYQEVNNPHLYCYVIHDESSSFGWISVVAIPKIGLEDKVYYIDELYVEDQHRNKRYGTKLLEYICTQFDESSLRLYVEVSNVSAIKLYKGFGFAQAENEAYYMIRSNSK